MLCHVQNGCQNSSQGLHGPVGLRAHGSQTPHLPQPAPLAHELAHLKRRRRQHRRETIQPSHHVVLRGVAPLAFTPVRLLGFQELQRVGQKLLAHMGTGRAVVRIEHLRFARGQPSLVDGPGQDLGVTGVGARHRNQHLHRAVRRDPTSHHQLLDRLRQHLDQAQSTSDPALGAPNPCGDNVNAQALALDQLLQEKTLLQG